MPSLLERLLRRASRRADPASPKPRRAEDSDVESIELALAQAEDIAARTTALAGELHRLLTSAPSRHRPKRPDERILH